MMEYMFRLKKKTKNEHPYTEITIFTVLMSRKEVELHSPLGPTSSVYVWVAHFNQLSSVQIRADWSPLL